MIPLVRFSRQGSPPEPASALCRGRRSYIVSPHNTQLHRLGHYGWFESNLEGIAQQEAEKSRNQQRPLAHQHRPTDLNQCIEVSRRLSTSSTTVAGGASQLAAPHASEDNKHKTFRAASTNWKNYKRGTAPTARTQARPATPLVPEMH